MGILLPASWPPVGLLPERSLSSCQDQLLIVTLMPALVPLTPPCVGGDALERVRAVGQARRVPTRQPPVEGAGGGGDLDVADM